MALKAHYKLNDDAATTVVIDETTVNNGTASSNTEDMSVTGKINKALEFDGTEYINCGTNASLAIIGDISFACWRKCAVTATIQAFGGVWDFLSGDLAWNIDTDTNGYFNVILTDDGVAAAGHVKQYRYATNTCDGEWHHYAFTFDASESELILYVDGVVITPVKVIDDAITSIHNGITAGEALYLGAYDDGTQYRLTGSLDEVKLYNNVLTLVEIQNLYHDGLDRHYLTTPSTEFKGLQSGLARPYWEVGITVSGASSTYSGSLGWAYGSHNDIMSMGTIDRAKPVEISELSKILAGNCTLTLHNGCGTYSPLATASIFTDADGSARDYMHSQVNVWGGFIATGGTAIMMQRGSFLLTKLRLDSQTRKAYMTCEDAAKIPLAKYIGLPDTSGTATTWTPPSGITTKAIMTEICSAVGMSASQYDITETGLTFPTFSAQNEKASDALAKLAQANDGFMYTNGEGKLVFDRDLPVFSGGGADLALTDSGTIRKARYTIDMKNLINKVVVNYGDDTNDTRVAEDATVTKGHEEIIDNEIIDRPSIANNLSSRLLTLYKVNRPFMEIDGLWFPSVELNDEITIDDAGTHQSTVTYEVYRIREDIVNCTTKLYGLDLTQHETKGPSAQKWGFVSTNELTNASFETGDPPDDWTLVGAASTVAQDAVTKYLDSNSAKVTRNGTNCYIYQNIHTSKSIEYWQGKTVTFSCWVYATVANRVPISIQDGVDITVSSFHTGGGGWELLTVTHTINAAATIVRARCQIITTDTDAYFDGALITESSSNDRSSFFEEGWHSGFAFASVSGTGFDDEGNDDDAITTGYFISGTTGVLGTGVTGIEKNFLAY